MRRDEAAILQALERNRRDASDATSSREQPAPVELRWSEPSSGGKPKDSTGVGSSSAAAAEKEAAAAAAEKAAAEKAAAEKAAAERAAAEKAEKAWAEKVEKAVAAASPRRFRRLPQEPIDENKEHLTWRRVAQYGGQLERWATQACHVAATMAVPIPPPSPPVASPVGSPSPSPGQKRLSEAAGAVPRSPGPQRTCRSRSSSADMTS